MALQRGAVRLSRVLQWVNTHWPLLAVGVTLLSVFVAWWQYDVALLQPLEEIAAKQAEYRTKVQQRDFQKRMVERHLQLGNEFLGNSRYKAATAEFNKALKLDKQNPEAQMGLFKTGVYDAMQTDFIPEVIERQIEFILQEAPEDPYARVLKGNLYAQLEDFNSAKKEYERALAVKIKPASAYFNLGLIYEKENRLDEALAMYKQAVKDSKWNERYLTNLASLYRQKKQYAEAIKHYELVLTLDYQYLLPYLEIALAYRLAGEVKMAQQYQKKLVAHLEDPAFAKHKKNQGVWFFKAGDTHVSLFSLEDKTCYAHYSLSLSSHILRDSANTERYAQKAKAVKSDEHDAIVCLLCEDTQQFAKTSPAYEEQMGQYRKRYLGNCEHCPQHNQQ